MRNIKILVNKIVENAVFRQITVAEAVEQLLQEIGRCGRILVVDENLYDLAQELISMNYVVHLVTRGANDEQIKATLGARVFITINGKDFVDDAKKYRYGLIWVRKSTDAKVLARKIEAVLMSANFRRNLEQVVKI